MSATQMVEEPSKDALVVSADPRLSPQPHFPPAAFPGGKPTIEQDQDAEESSCVKSYRYASYYWSMAITIFGVVMIMFGIGMKWNNPPWSQKDSHPVFEAFLFLVMMYWIALLEGCQISIVGLQKINMELHKETHPRAYAVCKLLHKGPGVEKFLVGRQFLLLFNGFLCSKLGGANMPENFKIGEWEWGDEATQFLWLNSVLLMIVIIVPGQLTSQLMAADKMMEFLDLKCVAAYYTVALPTLFIESLGIVHSAYILKDFLAWATGIDTSEADPSKNHNKNVVYYSKCLLSVSAVVFSGIFLFKGWFLLQSGATDGAGWRHLPGWAAIVVSCFFLFIMACAEGLQVSALALAKTDCTTFKDSKPLAYATTQLLFKGRNMNAFLVGRQFMVAMMMVLLGKVTSYAGGGGKLVGGDDIKTYDGSGMVNGTAGTKPGDDWGMGEGFNEWLLQTGWIGAVFVVNVAQLGTQVAASIFPIGFINNRFLNLLLRAMLLVEASGIVNACYPLAWGLDSYFKLRKDPSNEVHDFPTEGAGGVAIAQFHQSGVQVAPGQAPSGLHQPEQQYDAQYNYRVSFI